MRLPDLGVRLRRLPAFPLVRADAEMRLARGSQERVAIRTMSVAFSEREAVLSSLGELWERYAADRIPERHLLTATAAELGDRALRPSSLPLFSDEQYAQPGFAFVPFREETRLRWAPGSRIADNRRVYVPTQLVHAPAFVDFDDAPIAYATTSGMACGRTRDDAVLAGLLELIERDALVIAWYNEIPLPRVAPEILDDDVKSLCAADDERYRVLDASVFSNVPVAIAIRRASPEMPGVTVGAAAAPTLALAAHKAVREALATAYFVGECWARPVVVMRDEIATFSEHAAYHAFRPSPGSISCLEGDGVSSGPSPICEGAEGMETGALLRALCERIAVPNDEIYVVDTTPPELGNMTCVSVVVPQLCRIDVGTRQRYLGNRRIFERSIELGLRSDAARAATINREPHPLA